MRLPPAGKPFIAVSACRPLAVLSKLTNPTPFNFGGNTTTRRKRTEALALPSGAIARDSGLNDVAEGREVSDEILLGPLWRQVQHKQIRAIRAQLWTSSLA
jgi:hypothetical protein